MEKLELYYTEQLVSKVVERFNEWLLQLDMSVTSLQ